MSTPTTPTAETVVNFNNTRVTSTINRHYNHHLHNDNHHHQCTTTTKTKTSDTRYHFRREQQQHCLLSSSSLSSTLLIKTIPLLLQSLTKTTSKSIFYVALNSHQQQIIRSFNSFSKGLPSSATTTTTNEVNMPAVSENICDADFEYVYTNDTPVLQLDAKTSFENLTSEEKLYAHHLSKASWFGALCALFQSSSESPLIFALFRRLFTTQSLAELKALALGSGSDTSKDSEDSSLYFTKTEWRAFLVYAAAFYSNMGNYRDYGDSKFVPNLPVKKFDRLVRKSKAYANDEQFVGFIWRTIQKRMYSLESRYLSLGFAPKGVTTYFSSNMTEADAQVVKTFLQLNHIDAYNTRAMKDLNTGEYVVRLASVLPTNDPTDAEYMELFKTLECEGKRFRVERGDYAPILQLTNKHLEAAIGAALNQTEAKMLTEYVRHFRTGSLDNHKDGSRYWIKDKSPIVETYIGFIENYRDPAGQRAEFEGFVAMVNKEMTKKFTNLVNCAATFLPKLPWSKQFEKDHFLQPDFTSLDVLTFAGSGIPAGINIPNYEEIRQNEGFKNVSLGNVILASLKETKPNFLSESDAKMLEKYGVASFEVQVGLHELLGHGSGKLLKVDANGTKNFDPTTTINPLTGEPVTQWYAANETYDSKFGSFNSAYEECRAECVGLYLGLDPQVLTIFGHTDPAEQRAVIYVNWLSMIHKGIESLKMYNASIGKWLQAHSQARYVITRVLLESAKELITINPIDKSSTSGTTTTTTTTKDDDSKPNLLIKLTDDHELIMTKGKKAIGDFLLRLQTYKSLGDSISAKKMFDHYSVVSNDLEYPFLTFREIALARKKPRRMFVQSNTELVASGSGSGGGVGDTQVELRTYDSTHEGLIQSFLDHYRDEPALEQMLVDLWKKDEAYFPLD